MGQIVRHARRGRGALLVLGSALVAAVGLTPAPAMAEEPDTVTPISCTPGDPGPIPLILLTSSPDAEQLLTDARDALSADQTELELLDSTLQGSLKFEFGAELEGWEPLGVGRSAVEPSGATSSTGPTTSTTVASTDTTEPAEDRDFNRALEQLTKEVIKQAEPGKGAVAIAVIGDTGDLRMLLMRLAQAAGSSDVELVTLKLNELASWVSDWSLGPAQGTESISLTPVEGRPREFTIDLPERRSGAVVKLDELRHATFAKQTLEPVCADSASELRLPLTLGELAPADIVKLRMVGVDGERYVAVPAPTAPAEDGDNGASGTTTPLGAGNGTGKNTAPETPADGEDLPIEAAAVGVLVGAAGMFLLSRRLPRSGADVTPGGATAAAPPGGPLPGGGLGLASAPPPAPAPLGLAVEPVQPLAAAQPRPRPAGPGWTALVANGPSIRLEDVGLTRIAPHDLARGRVWADLTDRYLALGGWTEKVVGKGEDAEPLFRFHESGRGLVAVFDGVGGAGAGIARRLADGTELTGAYVGSRLTSAALESWVTGLVDRQQHIGDEDPAHFATALRRILSDEAGHQPPTDLGLKGSMTRQLPTTMAAVAFADDGQRVAADVLWAGDSRAYALGPRTGLQVLTIDDTRETDALSLIRNDMPMANLISADRPFTLHHRRFQVDRPTLLLAATDGCFGYVLTPAHFEFLVLQTLLQADDPTSWAAALVEELDAVAGDDVSFSVAGFGFTSWDDLRDSYVARCEYLRSEHWDRFAGVGQDREALERLRDASWAAYRDDYHELVEHERAGR